MKKISISVFMFLAVCLSAQSVLSAELAIARSVSDEDLAWGPCPELFSGDCELAVLHGDPAKPNADIYFRVPGNYSFPAHWHTSAERIVMISGEMDLSYRGQATTHLKPGMYAYGPAMAVHEGTCVSKEPCLLVIAFEQAIDIFEAKP